MFWPVKPPAALEGPPGLGSTSDRRGAASCPGGAGQVRHGPWVSREQPSVTDNVGQLSSN